VKKRLYGTLLGAAVVIGFVAVMAPPAGAEHFDILLRVNSGEKQVQASMDTTPPIGGVNPRPVLRIKAGDEVRVAWNLKNSSPHGALKAVTIHFFVVHEAQVGQKPVPNPAGQAGIVDTSFTTDMSLGATAAGSARVHLSDRGNYLVRLQSEGTHEEAGHEHFSAVDVVVE
jgi:hypothetical protein